MPARNHLSKWTMYGALAVTLVACPKPQPRAEASDAADAADPDAAPFAASLPGAPTPSNVHDVVFAPDGTLIVQNADDLIAIGPAGKQTKLSFPPDSMFEIPRLDFADGAPAHAGVPNAVVVTDDAQAKAWLVTLAPLRTVVEGPGKFVQRGMRNPASIHAIVQKNNDGTPVSVTFVVPGTAAPTTLVLPKTPLVGDEAPDVSSVLLTEDGHFAIVTLETGADGAPQKAKAFDYDVATGRILGNAIADSGEAPAVTVVGDFEIGVAGAALSFVDLTTAKTLRQTKLACGTRQDEGHVLGNPILDPLGRTIILTCNDDGLVLDATSLRVRRKVPHLVPGCDNGPELPAHFSADGKQLILEGCGGEARLDVATGTYICGDDDGLMGRDYDPFGDAPETTPSQAVGVPPCHPRVADDAPDPSMRQELSPHYALDVDSVLGQLILVGRNGVTAHLALGPDQVAVAPAEDRFAEIQDHVVVVRALPGGAVLQTIPF